MIKVEIIKQAFTDKVYQAVISDDKGHMAETLVFPYGKLKNGLKKKNIQLPAVKDLNFDTNYTATIIFEDKMWGKE